MSSIASADMKKALEAITDMITRSKAAQAKFHEGTSQYTLQRNRIYALEIAYSLIRAESGEGSAIPYEKKALKKALAPIKSLIGKSEKAKTKIIPMRINICNLY